MVYVEIRDHMYSIRQSLKQKCTDSKMLAVGTESKDQVEKDSLKTPEIGKITEPI